MPSLMDSLCAFGVPIENASEELEEYGNNLLSSVDRTELDDPAMLSRAASECAPEFIALAEAAARAQSVFAERLVETAAETLPILTGLVFLESADIALNCPRLLESKGKSIALALSDRIIQVKESDGLQAYSYLEVLTRLGLTQKTARYRALELLTEIDPDCPEDLLERLPKLIGLAVDFWAEPGLYESLTLLREFPLAAADASYELAQCALRYALESNSIEEVLVGMKSAQDLFTVVESMEEGRDDAVLFRSALELTMRFAGGGPPSEVDAEIFECLNSTIWRRAALSTRAGLGAWATPRRQAEVEWFSLARTLRSAMAPLAEPSWNAPADALSRVLAAYKASRSVTVMAGDGLRVVLEPAVEGAFLDKEGLRHHLAGLVEDEALPSKELEMARDLLSAVSTLPTDVGGGGLGKVRGAAPNLAAELGDELSPIAAAQFGSAVDETPELVQALENGARTRARGRAQSADPSVDRILERVMADLAHCDGLTGSALQEFTELLTVLLRFMADRANVGRPNGGPDVGYLFKPTDGTSVLETSLQRDVATWLKATPLRTLVRLEEPDVGGGRADLTVTDKHKFTIEVKRELKNASQSNLLKSYGGQAAAYSVTGPAVSLEMVLDLTDRTLGTPSLSESVWVESAPISGGKPRSVVTMVVRGNRLTPSKTKSG